MQKKDPADNSLLKQIETVRCDNHLQFPYYPVISMIVQNAETYIAAKSRDTIIIYVFKNHSCIKSYSLNQTSLPTKSSITSISFVCSELIDKYKQDQPGTLYMMIGYYSGYLYLVKILKKNINIIKKHNKASQAQSGLFSKTMTYFSGSNSAQYQRWQNTTVIKTKIYRKSLSYLFRTNILVILNGIESSADDIQKKFDWVSSQSSTLSKNNMTKTDKYFYFICNDYKLIRHQEKCIIGFNSTVSTYQISNKSLFVGTYDGLMMEFETQTYNCLRRISTVVAIKYLSIVQMYVILCLQDDYIQVIDLVNNKYINLSGHRSFTGCVLPIQSTILLGSYDGYISLTNLKNIKQWKKLQIHNNSIHSSFEHKPSQVQVDQKSKLKSEVGIGMGFILGDILALSMFDNTVKIFKVNFDQYKNDK